MKKAFISSLFICLFSFKINAQSASLPINVKISSFALEEINKKIPLFLFPGEVVKGSLNTISGKSHYSLISRLFKEKGYKIITDTTGVIDFLYLEYNYFITEPVLYRGKVYEPIYTPSNTVRTNINITNQINNSPINNENTMGNIKPMDFGEINIPQAQRPSGYIPIDIEQNVYTRKLSFKCYSRKNEKIEEKWVSEIESQGVTSDINIILPALLYASMTYFYKNLIVPKEVNVKTESRSYIKFINE